MITTKHKHVFSVVILIFIILISLPLIYIFKSNFNDLKIDQISNQVFSFGQYNKKSDYIYIVDNTSKKEKVISEIKPSFAVTEEEKAKGLSGKNELAENEGLLFVFDKNDRWGIWMKDMLFPIDIIWFDENKKVVFMEENIKPESYPWIFSPDVPARYILEVPAGFVSKNKIEKGMELIVNL